MVSQDGEQQEVSTETQIDADQQSLDGEQGEGAAPQYVTVEQFQEMQQAYQGQLQSANRMINGLQSKIDQGLNAIRRDTEEQRKREAEALQRRTQFEASIANLPDEQQQAMRVLHEQQERAIAAAQPAPQPQQQPMTADQQAAWAEVQQYVRDWGVDPADTRINYTVLTDQTKSEADRRQAFNQSLRGIIAAPAAPAQQQQPPPKAPPPTANPPVDSGNRGGGGYRNADDVMSAYIEGRITKDVYQEKMAGFGVSV